MQHLAQWALTIAFTIREGFNAPAYALLKAWHQLIGATDLVDKAEALTNGRRPKVQRGDMTVTIGATVLPVFTADNPQGVDVVGTLQALIDEAHGTNADPDLAAKVSDLEAAIAEAKAETVKTILSAELAKLTHNTRPKPVVVGIDTDASTALSKAVGIGLIVAYIDNLPEGGPFATGKRRKAGTGSSGSAPRAPRVGPDIMAHAVGTIFGHSFKGEPAIRPIAELVETPEGRRLKVIDRKPVPRTGQLAEGQVFATPSKLVQTLYTHANGQEWLVPVEASHTPTDILESAHGSDKAVKPEQADKPKAEAKA